MKQNLKHRWSIGHNYLTGIAFGKWCKLLALNGFQISPVYQHRAFVITMPIVLSALMVG